VKFSDSRKNFHYKTNAKYLPARKTSLYSMVLFWITRTAWRSARKKSHQESRMKTHLTGESRGGKTVSSLTHDCSGGTMGHCLDSHQWDRGTGASRLEDCAIPAKIRNRQQRPITIRDRRLISAPQDSLTFLLGHLTDMHKLALSQVLEFLRSGLPPKSTLRDQRESAIVCW
jgi:hypothetical protein